MCLTKDDPKDEIVKQYIFERYCFGDLTKLKYLNLVNFFAFKGSNSSMPA